jgi:MFS family permease
MVYFPVWVDEFAPSGVATLWMAVIQAGAPLGIMVGYVFAGVLTADADPGSVDYVPCDTSTWFFPLTPSACNWRLPFYAQSAVLVLFSAAVRDAPRSDARGGVRAGRGRAVARAHADPRPKSPPSARAHCPPRPPPAPTTPTAPTTPAAPTRPPPAPTHYPRPPRPPRPCVWLACVRAVGAAAQGAL